MKEGSDDHLRGKECQPTIKPKTRFRRVLLALILALPTGLTPYATLQGQRAHAAGFARPLAAAVTVLNAGKRPEPVIVDAAHHRVYIGTETGGSVTDVDDRTGRILKTIRVGREVEDLALDPTTGMLYAASSVRSRLSVINTSTLRLAAVVSGVKDASGVALDPARHRLYVTEQNANAVAVLDTRVNRVVDTLKLAGGPLGIGLDTALHRVFVGLYRMHRVDVIAESGNRVIGSIQVGDGPLHPFRVDATAHRLYLLNSRSSTLSIVDTRALRVVQTIPTGRYPEGLDVRPGRSRAYVSNEGDPGTDKNSGHTASVIDLRSGRIVDTLPTLKGPDGIAYDPNTGSVYVSNEDPGLVSVITLPPRDR